MRTIGVAIATVAGVGRFATWLAFPTGLIHGRVHGELGVIGDDLVAGVYGDLLGWLVLAVV